MDAAVDDSKAKRCLSLGRRTLREGGREGGRENVSGKKGVLKTSQLILHKYCIKRLQCVMSIIEYLQRPTMATIRLGRRKDSAGWKGCERGKHCRQAGELEGLQSRIAMTAEQ